MLPAVIHTIFNVPSTISNKKITNTRYATILSIYFHNITTAEALASH